MDSDFKICWTDEAINNLESILNYLEYKWTEHEIENFKKKLIKQIELIKNNPQIFRVSKYNPRLRKAVLSKQNTIFMK